MSTLTDLKTALVTHLEARHLPPPPMHRQAEYMLDALRLSQPHSAHIAGHEYGHLVARAARHGLQDACASIAGTLLELQEPLPWIYSYTPRCAEEDLGDRVAFAELVGPDGPFWAPECRVGFTVMDCKTTYPMHRHPAVELYLVIAGNALWRTDDHEATVAPGEWVLHRSDEPHEMRTFDEPLLALWSWSGDTESPALYL